MNHKKERLGTTNAEGGVDKEGHVIRMTFFPFTTHPILSYHSWSLSRFSDRIKFPLERVHLIVNPLLLAPS